MLAVFYRLTPTLPDCTVMRGAVPSMVTSVKFWASYAFKGRDAGFKYVKMQDCHTKITNNNGMLPWHQQMRGTRFCYKERTTVPYYHTIQKRIRTSCTLAWRHKRRGRAYLVGGRGVLWLGLNIPSAAGQNCQKRCLKETAVKGCQTRTGTLCKVKNGEILKCHAG